MTQRGKLPVILLVLLIVISLSLAGGVFFLLQKERAKNLSLQSELEDIKTRQKVTEKKLEESQKLASAFDLKLQEAKAQISALNTGLQQERTAKLEALAQIEQVRLDLGQQKALRSDLEKKFNQSQKEVEGIQAQLKDIESKKAQLEEKVKELEEQSSQGIELGKIVVGPEATASPAKQTTPSTKTKEEKPKKAALKADLEGQLLVINKEYNFVVISLGSEDGVALGDVFSVYHKNTYIGDVKIEKIHDSMAAAGFLTSDIKDKVNEGDKVVRKSK